jgi:hypothetical protein
MMLVDLKIYIKLGIKSRSVFVWFLCGVILGCYRTDFYVELFWVVTGLLRGPDHDLLLRRLYPGSTPRVSPRPRDIDRRQAPGRILQWLLLQCQFWPRQCCHRSDPSLLWVSPVLHVRSSSEFIISQMIIRLDKSICLAQTGRFNMNEIQP